MSDCLPLLALTIVLAQRHHASTWLSAIALLVSILIPYIKARDEALGCQVGDGLMSRAMRLILLVIGLISGPIALSVCLTLIVIGGGVTIYTRGRSCIKQLQSQPSH